MKAVVFSFKFAVFFAMAYLTADLSSLVLSYKIVHLNDYITFSAASIIFPLTYIISDITTEVYGYHFAKRVIWFSFFCDLTFSLMLYFIVKIPSDSAHMQSAYHTVLGGLLRCVLAEALGVLIGAFVNAYLISKWKLLINGRLFWLRSIGSSSIGEALLLLVSVPVAFLGVVSWDDIFKLIAVAYIYKVAFAIVVSGPANILANILKSVENIDETNKSVVFNPFKLD